MGTVHEGSVRAFTKAFINKQVYEGSLRAFVGEPQDTTIYEGSLRAMVADSAPLLPGLYVERGDGLHRLDT